MVNIEIPKNDTIEAPTFMIKRGPIIQEPILNRFQLEELGKIQAGKKKHAETCKKNRAKRKKRRKNGR